MSIRLKHFLKYQFPAIGWAFIIFIISSIPAKSIPSLAMLRYDKLIHVAIFMVLGMLVYRALISSQSRYSFSWGKIFFSLSVVILYGVLDETYQGTIPGRTLDIWDAVADTIGGLMAVLLLNIRHRIRGNATKRV